MREYKIKVDFKNNLIVNENNIELVQNDYNSSKFVFQFDDEYNNYTKTIKIKYPSEKILIDEINNNEFELKNILVESGAHEYEITCYDSISKITEYATSKFFVREELVKSDDEEVILNDNYPVLDSLINETREVAELCENAINETNMLDIQAEKIGNVSNVTITKKDGTKENIEILDGERGPQGIQGIQGQKGDTGISSLYDFSIENGILYINTQDGINEKSFSINENGEMEVEF